MSTELETITEEAFTPELKADYDLRVKAIEEKLGYKICGAHNRELTPCQNKAGKGTDHLGSGRCKYHGGRNQSPLAKQWTRGGLTSSIRTEHPMIRQKMEEISKDHDVFDLRKEILAIRAIMQIMMDQGEFLSALKAGVDVSKVIERLHNIEVGRRYVISVDNVGLIMRAVEEAIFRHVPDENTRHLVAEELTSLRVSAALPAAPIIDAEWKELIKDDAR